MREWVLWYLINALSMAAFPEPLLQELKYDWGIDEARFVEAHNVPAQVSVRYHRIKGGAIEAKDNLERVKWCGGAYYLPERPVFTLDPLYHAGAYYVQEASSMFLAVILEHLYKDATGLKVLDLCAAPGGKSTLIASCLSPDSLLICNEVIKSRNAILNENITRWGYSNAWVTCNDPKHFTALSGYFDAIVVDAPCSGSGLFRKQPQAINEWSTANVELCHQRQQRILEDILPALKEEGTLIYSTCSYSKVENEDRIEKLIKAGEVEPIAIPVSDEWGIVPSYSKDNVLLGYRFYPHLVKGEGFFIAVCKKIGSTGMLKEKRTLQKQDKAIESQCGHFLKEGDYNFIRQHNEQYAAFSSHFEQAYNTLQKYLYFTKIGTEIGAPAGNEWIPAHSLALSLDFKGGVSVLEVDRKNALKFLKREAMDIESPAKGWYAVCYKGLPIGWVKAIGNRINNYLPKHWRIRMEVE
ncbi:MAG: RNA methyltransferase [Chitinophagia bacterium]|nr:RNA methyltransferase [Chitinophagia bacterium]